MCETLLTLEFRNYLGKLILGNKKIEKKDLNWKWNESHQDVIHCTLLALETRS